LTVNWWFSFIRYTLCGGWSSRTLSDVPKSDTHFNYVNIVTNKLQKTDIYTVLTRITGKIIRTIFMLITYARV